MFVGFSKNHSSLVPLCLNTNTGKITPQFHVIFDEKFQSVASLPSGSTLQNQWLTLLRFGTDCFLEVDDDDLDDDASLGQSLPPPRLLPTEFTHWFNSLPGDGPPPSTPITITDQHNEIVVLDSSDSVVLIPDHLQPDIISEGGTDTASSDGVSEGAQRECC